MSNIIQIMDLIQQAICANIFVLAFQATFPQVVEFSIVYGHELEITNTLKLSELRGRRTAHVAYVFRMLHAGPIHIAQNLN